MHYTIPIRIILDVNPRTGLPYPRRSHFLEFTSKETAKEARQFIWSSTSADLEIMYRSPDAEKFAIKALQHEEMDKIRGGEFFSTRDKTALVLKKSTNPPNQQIYVKNWGLDETLFETALKGYNYEIKQRMHFSTI